MARTDTLEHYLTDIADAIREKTGSSDPIQASSFDTSIGGIPSGGGGPTGHVDAEGLSTIGWTQTDIDNLQENGVFWDSEDDNLYKLTAEELPGEYTNSNVCRYYPGKNSTDYQRLFNSYSHMIGFPASKFRPQPSDQNLFYGDHNLRYITANLSNQTTLKGAFQDCATLKKIDITCPSSAVSYYSTFSNCNSIEDLSNLSIKPSDLTYAFQNCYNLTKLPTMNTADCTSLSYAFANCYSLTKIPKIDTSSVTGFNNMFDNCNQLVDLGGFENAGQAFDTSKQQYYSAYTINLNTAPLLSHDSIMNVINNLYDIGSKGCQPQNLNLGMYNRDKVTAEEKAIATAKGWVVS